MRGEARWGASLAALARLRQGSYRLLSALLRYPDQERLASAPQAARYLRRRSPWAARLAFYGPWDALLRLVMAPDEGRIAEAQASYSRLFVGNSAQPPVPLCEGAYLDPQGASPGQALAEVEAIYAGAGLHVQRLGESPDHASVELEFLSFLCGQEAEAWENREGQAAGVALGRQRRFLERHLCPWLPALAEAVAARAGHGLYPAVTRAAWSLAAHDVDLAGALAVSLAAQDGSEGRGCAV
ncbi:MAG: molecular chaperone TorD family protein [Chloroflexi bacterium]|nr:molecular chaperone TorD family protein [Chloroflexota bacterium]